MTPGPRLPRAALVGVALAAFGCAGAGGESHDVVPESRDVRVMDASAAGDLQYDYVAKRPLAVVALAEARGIDPAVAHAAIDRLADALDTCATDQGRQAKLVEGAARVVAQIAPDGSIAGTSLRVDPGAGIAENAVVCLVAPLRMLSFPSADAGARGFAIEALWGRVIPQR